MHGYESHTKDIKALSSDIECLKLLKIDDVNTATAVTSWSIIEAEGNGGSISELSKREIA